MPQLDHPPKHVDFIIIGAGVMGMSIAYALKRKLPTARILIIEKENDVCRHASGLNSGVLHAGFYYTKDSLKAQFTRDGNEALRKYCEKKNIGIIGLSFKKGTDDLRFSPTVDIVEYLYNNKYSIKIWDKAVCHSQLIGSNKKFISKQLPSISDILSDNLNEVVGDSEIILVTQKDDDIIKIVNNNKNKIIIDVARIFNTKSNNRYRGICW